jgi:hypothetical protein
LARSPIGEKAFGDEKRGLIDKCSSTIHIDTYIIAYYLRWIYENHAEHRRRIAGQGGGVDRY